MKPLQYFYYILLITGLFTITTVNNTSAQSKTTHLKGITVVHKIPHSPTYKDSILLEPQVTFDQQPVAVKGNQTTYAKVVKFTLKITNNCGGAIPDPIAYKGSKFVKLYINGHLNNPKVLFDETEDAADTDKLILTGQSQTFYCDWLLSKRTTLLRKYGRKFTVQFSYIHKRSPLVHVDLNSMTAKS